RVDVSRALAMPGVVAAFSGQDLADDWAGPLLMAWPVTEDINNPSHWPLTKDKARHQGDGVAVVIAEYRAAARDAAAAVDVVGDADPTHRHGGHDPWAGQRRAPDPGHRPQCWRGLWVQAAGVCGGNAVARPRQAPGAADQVGRDPVGELHGHPPRTRPDPGHGAGCRRERKDPRVPGAN